MANPPYCVRVGGAGGSSDWHHESELRQIVDRLSNTLIMKTVRWMGVLTSLEWLRIDKAGGGKEDHVGRNMARNRGIYLGEASGDSVATR